MSHDGELCSDEIIDIAYCDFKNSYKPKIVLPGEFRYKGYNYPGIISRNYMKNPSIYEAREEDIFVVGYPKSGQSWLAEILSFIVKKGDIKKAKSRPLYEKHLLVELDLPFVFERNEEINRQREKFGLPAEATAHDLLPYVSSPRVIRSHLPYEFFPPQAIVEKKCKVLYIGRNFKDVLVSGYYMLKMDKMVGMFTGTWEEFWDDKIFHPERALFGGWAKHVLDWWEHRNDDNILFVKYEDLIKKPKESINKMCEFTGYTFDEAIIDKIVEASSFKEMKKDNSMNFIKNEDENLEFVRKGMIGDWKNHFSSEQIEEANNFCEEVLKGTGLYFEDN